MSWMEELNWGRLATYWPVITERFIRWYANDKHGWGQPPPGEWTFILSSSEHAFAFPPGSQRGAEYKGGQWRWIGENP